VQDAVAAGERDPAAVRSRALDELISSNVQPDYLELVSADTLMPVQRIDGDVLAVVAARVGVTRLIDNTLIQVVPARARTTANGRA